MEVRLERMNYALPFKLADAVIELGGGSQAFFHPNVDVRQVYGVDIVADLSKPIPLPDAAFTGLFSKYCLEHVSWRVMPGLVKEAYRLLKPGGTAVFVIPNTKAQMRWALEQDDEAYDKVAQCLFGDLDYRENGHKSAFSPAYAIRIFREAGFVDVAVIPHGELGTDQIVEARKSMPEEFDLVAAKHDHMAIKDKMDPTLWTPKERQLAYDRHYFDGGTGGFGGYSREGYRDFPIHWYTFRRIMELKPESVLEVGCARGYLLKRLQDVGIRAEGLEVSRHCYLTRVCEGVREWDVTKTPWPFKDKEFDLAISVATLEHIPENAIDQVASEIRRITKRGLHGADFGAHDDGFDKTHCLFRDAAWWRAKLGEGQQVVDKEDLEKGPAAPPGSDGLVKLNLGSHRVMYHHGWINVDVVPLEEYAQQNGYIFRRHDLSAGIPWENSSVDLISISHVLEHFSYEKGLALLQECHRTMKPGAIIRVIVPDALKLAREYVAGTMGQFDEMSNSCAGTPYQSFKLWELLFSGHQTAYDEISAAGIFGEAGFSDVQLQSFRKSTSKRMKTETIDLFPELSLFVEAKKSEVTRKL